jgi:cob(I)alamin adenosyltransferase
MTPTTKHLGDDGTSSLLGPGRFPKHDVHFEALGSLDEVSASLGVVRALCNMDELTQEIITIQRDLYGIMAEIASTGKAAGIFHMLDQERITWLETVIEKYNQQVKMPEEFIVPGDTLIGAHVDQSRTIVRRAERRVSELFSLGEIQNKEILRYLNRLSTFCFIVELFVNCQEGSMKPILSKRRSG